MSTILVVDDDPSVQSLLRTLLELEGHVVRVAGDGRAALREVAEDRPDAMVLDIMLPELDGLGVLQRLGMFGVTDTMPVIVLTADRSLLLGPRCLALGARHVLTKPFDSKELIEMLAALLAEP